MLLQLVDFVLHVNVHLADLFRHYGTFLYAILFLVLFCETGLVFTPFLPGDSLLFASGALCASTGGAIDLKVLLLVLLAAPLLGDQCNYWVGRLLGTKLPFRDGNRFLRKAYLDEAQGYYARYGTLTIVLARFMPVVRTFAPFAAGLARMGWKRYAATSVAASCLWVLSFTLLGWKFGSLPAVQRNFTHVVLGIVAVSFLPLVYKAISGRKKP
jgi:membrane-associated protein